MFFDKVNIREKLTKERNNFPELLTEINDLLLQSAEKDKEVLSRLKGNESVELENIQLLKADYENLFTLKEIKEICIKYRLRFLDSKHFKKEFPYEAIKKINEFEKQYNTKIKNFKIIAPSKAFDLMDVNDDPLLFAKLGNNCFYLIHNWGKDLTWYRKFVYFPIRNLYSYFYSIIVLAALFAFSIPFSWLQVQKDNELYIRMWFTMHCTIGFFFFILFLGATTQSSFSSMSWKSKYFNE